MTTSPLWSDDQLDPFSPMFDDIMLVTLGCILSSTSGYHYQLLVRVISSRVTCPTTSNTQYYCVLLVVGHVTLVDITRTTILPGALKVKSLQFLSISGSYVFNPHVHDFQISRKDLTMWLDSRILAFANAGRHAPLSSHLKYNTYGDCNADKREFSWC